MESWLAHAVTALITAAVTSAGLVTGAYFLFRGRLSTVRRQEREDAAHAHDVEAELEERSINRLTLRNDQLYKRVFDMQDSIIALQTQAHNCELRESEIKEELKQALYRIGHLEKGMGLGPGEPRVGIVVADLHGIIRAYSPTLVPLLRWLPEEMHGQPLTKIIPPELRERHLKAFALFVADERRTTDSSKIFLFDALSKSGDRVPVMIQLDGWQSGNEGHITATIRERQIPMMNESIEVILPAKKG